MSDEMIEIPAVVAYEGAFTLRWLLEHEWCDRDRHGELTDLIHAIEATRQRKHSITIELTTEERDAYAHRIGREVFPVVIQKLIEACCASREADDDRWMAARGAVTPTDAAPAAETVIRRLRNGQADDE